MLFTTCYDIDVSPGGIPLTIDASQYDANARTILFNLISRNGVLVLPSGVKAEVRGTKPDGNGFSYDCAMSGNQVTVQITEQMCAAAGRVYCELVIYTGTPATEAEDASADFQQLCTATFFLMIKRAALDKDTLKSGSEIKQLITVIDRTDELLAAAATMDEAKATVTAKTQEATDAAGAAKRSEDAAAESLGSMRELAEETEASVNDTLHTVEDKTQQLLKITYDSDYLAKQALEKAEAAGNEAAETSGKLDQVNETMTEVRILAGAKVDGAFEENGYLYLTSNNEVVVGPLGPFSSNGSGGGGGSAGNNAVIKVSNTTGWMSKTIAPNSECPVSLNWSSLEDDMPTGNGNMRITVNNVVKLNTGVPQGNVTVDLAPFCAQGSNTCKIQITDMYGNSRTINFSITMVVLTLSSLFDASAPFSGAISFPYTPVGAAVDKTVHFILDGVEIATQSTSVSGRQVTYTIPAQPHGAHALRVYFEATVNGEEVRSNELYYEFISLEQLNESVIIVSSFNTTSVDQYTSVVIPYRVYAQYSDRVDVKLYLNDALVSSQTVDRTEQSFTFRTDTAGTTVFKIMAGETEKTFTLNVKESAVKIEAETEDLVLYLNAQGRSNNEETRSEWKYGDIEAELQNFSWRLDGWQNDADGIDVLRLVDDARVVIPYKMFENDFKATGKTIEIEFATREVSDYTVTLLSCFADDIGIRITPQNVVFKGAQNEISTLYKDNEHIRLSIVVEKQNENRLILVYINGIMSRAIQYASGERFSQLSPVGITIGSNDCGIDIYNIRVYDNSLSRKQILDNWIADTQVGELMLNRYTHNNVYDEYGNITIANLPTDLPYMILEATELPQYKGDKKTISGSFTVPGYTSRSFTFSGCQINVQGTSSAIYYRKNYDLQFKEGFTTPSGTVDTYAIKPDSIPFNRFVLKADVASSESTNNTGLTSFYSDTCPYKTPEQVENPKVRQGIEGIPIVVFWYNPDTQTTSFLGKYNFNLPKRAPEPLGFSGNMESWEWERNNSANVKFQDDDFLSQSWDEVKQEYYPTWYDDFEARFPSDEWRDYSKLKEFLSWVKSTWRDAATGEELPEPVVYRLNSTITVNDYSSDSSFTVEDEIIDDVNTGYKIFTFTKDTPAYRLTKFKAECPDYVELDSAVYYYLFTETFLMIDSRAKNMFPSFNGGPVTQEGRKMDRKVVFMPYDMDTALGTNNSGVLMFGYYLEDTDHVSSVISGDGSGSSNAPVFNAQDSVFWTNLRDSFRAEITTMYRNLRANRTWSYAALETMYEEHQSKWPEAVFNEDAYTKYIVPLVDPVTVDESTGELIRTDRYLTMLQGSKTEQRKWWLFNRFRYMDSKYVTGDASSNVINIRLFNSGRLSITPAIDLYVGVSFGGGTTVALKRTTANNPVDFDYVSQSGVTEMETWIYSADMITDVGDLSVFYPNECDFSKATRLKNLKIGDAAATYSNANLRTIDVRNSALLEHIDVRNCPQLAITVNLENSPRLKEAYFDGTAITGVDLVDGGAIETLHLPGTITTLTLLNLSKLSVFVIPSFANVSRVMLANMSNEIIDPLSLLHTIRANSQVNIQGLNLSMNSVAEVEEFYDLLDTMKGVTRDKNSNGEWIYTDYDQAQVSGTIHLPALTTDQMRELKARYTNINFTADVWTYRVRFFNGDTLLRTESIVAGNDVADPVTAGTISTPEKPSVGRTGYTYSGWDKSLTNISADTDLHAVFTESQAYEVTFKNWDDTVLLVKQVPEGQTCPDPVKTGEIETPTKEADSSYVYSFLGWTGAALVNVTSDRTVTARFSQVASYTITFVDYDNTVLLTWYRQNGASIVDPIQLGILETPVRADDWSSHKEYVYNKWDGQNANGSMPNVSGNRTYKATYTTKSFYGYTFKDYDGTELYREKWYSGDTATDPVAEGRMPTPTREPDENYHYEFWKWDRVFPHPISQYNTHLTVTAKYRTDAVHTVTFKDWDGTVLDSQEVQDGYNAVDPVKTGRIATPLRPSNQQYDFTYSGWNRAFSEITADLIVTASYTSVLRKYTVTFMKDDNVTVVGSAIVDYGKNVRDLELENWPIITADSEQFLYSWNPTVNSIVADTVTYPQWKSVLTDSWADIFAAEEDGTYKDKYKIGDVKLMDLGSEGVIPMRIVGFDCDELSDGSGNAKISWIAVSPLKTKIRCGYRSIATTDTTIKRFEPRHSVALGDYYESTNQGIDKSVSLSSFTITAEEETDVTIWVYASSEDDCDCLDVWLDDDLLFYEVSGVSGDERQKTVHLTAGESMSVVAQYSKDTRTHSAEDIARIRFISQGSISVTQEEPTAIKTFGSNNTAIQGWPTYTMRTELHEKILPKFPEIVRNHVCEVKKSSTIAYSSSADDAITDDSIWVPSTREMNYYGTNSTNVEKTGPCYNTAFPNQDSRYARKNGAPAGYTALRSYYRISSGYPAAFIGDLGGLSAYNGYTSKLFINIGFCT